MNINEFKKFIEEKINTQRVSLKLLDKVKPQVFFITKDSDDIAEVEINPNTMNKDDVAEMIKFICSKENIQAISFLFDGCTLMTDNLDNLPVSIANTEGRIQGILSFLYTKEKTELQQTPYQMLENGTYWFGDMGWKNLPNIKGRFANPFM